MEIFKKLDPIRKLSFENSQPTDNQKDFYIQIQLLNYQELGYLVADLLKLCILALEQKAQNQTENQYSSINIDLVLSVALQLLPLDEFELLSEIYQKQNVDSEIKL